MKSNSAAIAGTALLADFSAALNGSEEPEQLLRRAVSLIPQLLRVERATLSMPSNANGPLVISSGSRRSGERRELVAAIGRGPGSHGSGTLTLAGKGLPLDVPRQETLDAAIAAIGSLCERVAMAETAADAGAFSEALESFTRLMSAAGDEVEKLNRAAALMAGAANGAAALGETTPGKSAVRWFAASGLLGDGKDVPLVSETSGSLAVDALVRGLPAVDQDIADPRRRLPAFCPPASRSAGVFPLRAGGVPHGVALVVSQSPGAFRPALVNLLTAMADSLGVFLKAARLERALSSGLAREQHQLESFQAAAEGLALEMSPDAALRQFADSARRLVGAKFGGVVVWDSEGNVRNLVSLGLPTIQKKHGLGDTLQLHELLGLVRYSLVQEKKRAIRVADSSLEQNKADPEVPLLRSLLGVPFTGKDGSPGAFFLVDKESEPRFSASDERLLQLFSSMAAVLLDNIRLYNALERQRTTLSSIQMSMDEGLVVLDSAGGLIFSNPAAARLLDSSLLEPEGQCLGTAIRENAMRFEKEEEAEEIAGLLEGGVESALSRAITLAHPKRIELALSIFPIDVSDNERLTGILLRDITDERDLQRRRDTFVSVASHELRTPMTTVMGFTELLIQRETNAEQRQSWLTHMHEDSKRVLRIVDDLLDVSRVQTGNMTANLAEVDLGAVARAVVEELASTSDQHEFAVQVPAGLPLTIADPDKASQVLINLVTNAIKYSPKGGKITISARHDAAAGANVLSVADQGIGIAEEDKATLFSTFHRIQRPETEGIRGTGLGLYVVKSLTELMGGSVWVESGVDQGSTFHVALPVAKGGDASGAAHA
ncbi:MAG: ATP-binding protein [Dehalococcoidia bacterium]